MRKKYEDWIKAYVAREKRQLLGKCRDATEEMQKDFPELKEVRGHVLDLAWGMRGHFWLEDASGVIIDPTKAQFPAPAEYIPWKPGDKVQVGRCMNCGDEIWEPVDDLLIEIERKSVCGESCEEKLRREYG